MSQQDKISRLNLQAHQSAQYHTDEYVVDNIVSYDKITLLFNQLMVAEVCLFLVSGIR